MLVPLSYATIMYAEQSKKTYYDAYTAACAKTQKQWDEFPEPNLFDTLLGADPKPSIEEIQALTPPLDVTSLASLDQYSYKNTLPNGGSGTPSAGLYNLATKGFKPYGLEGQGPKTDMNYATDMSDQDRFMIVQVLPFANYTQDTNKEVFTMTIGAYGWNATNPWDTTEAVKPADCVINGATTIKATLAAASAAFVAVSLY